MSYLLAQILVCLLIAGLIGAVIGWLLRGGCSRKLRDCEDEWKMKMGSLESEHNSKLNRKDANYADTPTNKEVQAATLKRHAEHVEAQTPSYSYEEELKEKLDQAQNAKSVDTTSMKSTVAGLGASGVAALATTSGYADELKAKSNPSDFDLNGVKQLLMHRGISLSDEKIKLYANHGVDFEHTNNLEDNYHVDTIEGIDQKYAQGLREMGIRTTQDLVKKLHKNHDAIDQIAKTLKIEPSALSSWISMADLIQLPGVDAKSAALMQTVGISTATELGITNANSLHSEMLAFNKKSPIAPEVPSMASLSLWSKIAKLLG